MPDALQFLVLTVAGWVSRHQEDLIDYLREENTASPVRPQLDSAVRTTVLKDRQQCYVVCLRVFGKDIVGSHYRGDRASGGPLASPRLT